MIVTDTSTSTRYISRTEFLKRQHRGCHWGGGGFIARVLGQPDAFLPTPAAEQSLCGVPLYRLDRVEEAERTGALVRHNRSSSPIKASTLEYRRRYRSEEVYVLRTYAEQGAWRQSNQASTALSAVMRSALVLLAVGDVRVSSDGAVTVARGSETKALHASTLRALVRRGYVEESTYRLTVAGRQAG